jgi:GTP cyclohydrolase I
MYLTHIDPHDLHLTFKTIAGLLEAASLQISLTLPIATCVESPVSANRGSQVHDLYLRGHLSDNEFRLKTAVTTDVTTLCPCSKAISDYGAHNQRSRVTLSVDGEADIPYPLAAGQLVQLVRDSASCPVFPVVKRPDERAITMAAYDNPKFVEDLIRDLSASCRELAVPHQIEARNIESIHSHDAVARLSWS